jgi:hypothetical protein
LDIDRFHSDKPVDVIIYIRVFEFDPTEDTEKRWVTEQQLSLSDPDYVQLYNPDTITLSLPICRGVSVPDEVILADQEGDWVFINGQCDWDGEYSLENGEWVAPSSNDGGDGAQSDSNFMFIGIGAVVLVLIVILTLLFLRRSGGDGIDGDYKDFSLTGAFQEQDPVEQYVQQLIAQGYPEDTARSYAAQYAAQAGLTGGAGQQQAVQAAAPAATNPAMDAAYQQYYQQFITQGYDEQTAAAYAQQYAAAYIQQQG